MRTNTGQQRPFPALAIVIALFLICLIPGQLWITHFFPEAAGLVGFNPAIVFLDIPMHLPVTVDLIPVLGLFLVLYPMVVLIYPSRQVGSAWREAVQRTGAVIGGLIVWSLWLLAGGAIFYLVRDHLTREVRNGIDSFGINADIYIPYPGHETIQLRGGMILLVFGVIGMYFFARIVSSPLNKSHARSQGGLTREQRMSPYERMKLEKKMQERQFIPQPKVVRQEITSVVQQAQQAKPAQSGTKIQTNNVNGEPGRNQKPGIFVQPCKPMRSELPLRCHTQQVFTVEPEAVNYMPL